MRTLWRSIGVASIAMWGLTVGYSQPPEGHIVDIDFPVAWQLATAPAQGQVASQRAKDILLPGQQLQVYSIDLLARSTVYGLENPDTGARISIQFDAPGLVNSAVTIESWLHIGEAPEGVLLMAGTELFAFVSQTLLSDAR